jgi:hypothetical protein
MGHRSQPQTQLSTSRSNGAPDTRFPFFLFFIIIIVSLFHVVGHVARWPAAAVAAWPEGKPFV